MKGQRKGQRRTQIADWGGSDEQNVALPSSVGTNRPSFVHSVNRFCTQKRPETPVRQPVTTGDDRQPVLLLLLLLLLASLLLPWTTTTVVAYVPAVLILTCAPHLCALHLHLLLQNEGSRINMS